MILLFLWLIFTFMSTGQALVRCNGTVTKLQLCHFGTDYDKGFLKAENEEDKAKIWSSVHVFKISEFNENQQTITIDLLLSVWWYDQRLTIESNVPKE